MNAPLEITLISCAVLGFRHGFDYDHIAAISDITSVQQKASIAMRLGLLYALGHATMIALLGGIVILFQLSLPPTLDSWAERLVGLTLIVLGIYVLGRLVWGNPKAIPPSRAAVIIRSFRKLRKKYSSSPSDPIVNSSSDETLNYTGPIAFGVGVIHGLGAETPSQLALFLLAANLGGIAKGIGGMAMFLTGLLVMNTLMTASACGLFRIDSRPVARGAAWFIRRLEEGNLIVGLIHGASYTSAGCVLRPAGDDLTGVVEQSEAKKMQVSDNTVFWELQKPNKQVAEAYL
jgi:cytochrome c biogenesis protein CcdA